MRTEVVRYRTAFRTCLVSTGDTKLTTSDVEVEIRPNCTSLILQIVWSFENRPLTSTVYPLINLIHLNVPDQIGTLSQVGTERSQKEAGPFKNFLSHVGTMYLSFRS